jgi:predicted dehydrogenase
MPRICQTDHVAKLRVVIVGCGFMGRMHASVYRLLPEVELLGAVDRNPAKAAAFAEEFEATGLGSLEDALGAPEVDVIDVCLPTDLHASTTIQALEAGKHAMCEKPMALTVAECEAMSDAAKRADRRLMIGHCIRFWPEYAELKRLIDSGELGALTSLSLLRYGAFPSWASDNWMANEARTGGGALDMHIHDTDFALYALGTPDSLQSWGTYDGRGMSQIFTTMTFGKAVCHLEGGWNLPRATPFKHAFRAIFERGAAIMDAGPLTVYSEDGARVVEFEALEAAGGGNISSLGGYYHELKYFAGRILAGEPFETVTPETSTLSVKTVLEEIRLAKLASKS